MLTALFLLLCIQYLTCSTVSTKGSAYVGLFKEANQDCADHALSIYRQKSKLYLLRANGDSLQIFENSNIDNALNITKSSMTLVGVSSLKQADAVFGIYTINNIKYLAVVTKSERIPYLSSLGIMQVKEITLIHIPSKATPSVTIDMQTAAELLISNTFTRHSFYFSVNGYDITRSYQYNCLSSRERIGESWTLCDQRFFWNLNLVSDFIAAGLNDWIVPVTNGWMSSRNLHISGNSLKLSLFSRRSRRRQGPR
jgi:hypothetical protein